MRVPVAVPDPVSTFMPMLQRRHYAYFWGALVGGFSGLVALTVETVNVRSVQLEDLFIVAGSLFVPLLYVYYLDLRNQFVDPRWRVLVATFLLGALLAAPLALILELILPAGTGKLLPSLVTGAIEEFAKAVTVLWLLRKSHRYLMFEMDGIIIGAAAGMGFAAIEDIAYGASAFDHGLTNVVTTVWLRLLLGAFGHGTWTAIVVGTIWRVRGSRRSRVIPSVLAAYLVAVCLHALWDWNPAPDLWVLVWFLGVGILGLLILRTMIHHALAQEADYLAAHPSPAVVAAQVVSPNTPFEQ